MGHFVTGLIGSPPLLERFAKERKLHSPRPLIDGFAILALRDEDIDCFIPSPQTGHPGGFMYLSKQLMELLRDSSKDDPLMYFETEYFGGADAQGAIVFKNGSLVFGPESSESGPINNALRILRIRVIPPARDEFETVGLHRHRSTDDWIEEQNDES